MKDSAIVMKVKKIRYFVGKDGIYGTMDIDIKDVDLVCNTLINNGFDVIKVKEIETIASDDISSDNDIIYIDENDNGYLIPHVDKGE